MAYIAEVQTDFDSGLLEISDPRIYATKVKKDPDMPNFHEAMFGPDVKQYKESMQIEIASQIKQRTWALVPRAIAPNVIKSTWAFKLKRLPDGTPLKYKARFCVRGDLQQEGVDYFETYAPVVSWSTVRLVLTLVLLNGWATRQVDYTNAFAQAEMPENVFVEPPKLFEPKSGKDLVLKLLKSLYGLKQAPRTFFEKLRAGLLERGYIQSEVDPCLFMKKGIICVCYVDDTIFAGGNADELEEEIRTLGVAENEMRHTFELRNEGEVGDFLGIRIEKTGPKTFKLAQPGLIEKVLKAAGMEDCNGCATPASTTPLGSDLNGDPFDQNWEYASIVGMLMFLAANSRPDIAYAVHQAARFTHAPRASHAQAVKKILRYLKGSATEGLHMAPTGAMTLDTFVDADFGGTFAVEDKQSPDCAKSRTGFVIFFSGVPILWVSKLQTQVALSTLEAEYIALSQSMRDLIPLREILKEIMMKVFDKGLMHCTPACTTHSKTFEDVNAETDVIPASNVYEDNNACLQMARVPKLTPRTKHIAIPYHWFRTQVVDKQINIEPIDTTQQIADQFTKGLVMEKFIVARKALVGW